MLESLDSVFDLLFSGKVSEARDKAMSRPFDPTVDYAIVSAFLQYGYIEEAIGVLAKVPEEMQTDIYSIYKDVLDHFVALEDTNNAVHVFPITTAWSTRWEKPGLVSEPNFYAAVIKEVNEKDFTYVCYASPEDNSQYTSSMEFADIQKDLENGKNASDMTEADQATDRRTEMNFELSDLKPKMFFEIGFRKIEGSQGTQEWASEIKVHRDNDWHSPVIRAMRKLYEGRVSSADESIVKHQNKFYSKFLTEDDFKRLILE